MVSQGFATLSNLDLQQCPKTFCNFVQKWLAKNSADIVVNGYAFTKFDDSIHVLNLNNPEKASVLSFSGEVLETSMDDIELDIVLDYYARNRKYMEEE